ncbi:MAG: hypothetical protein R2865_14905 [Deinococcales bacterium]
MPQAPPSPTLVSPVVPVTPSNASAPSSFLPSQLNPVSLPSNTSSNTPNNTGAVVNPVAPPVATSVSRDPSGAVSMNLPVVPPGSSTNVRNIPISFNPANYGFLQNQQNEYRLIVIDDLGEREVISRMVNLGEILNTTVTIYGSRNAHLYQWQFFPSLEPLT